MPKNTFFLSLKENGSDSEGEKGLLDAALPVSPTETETDVEPKKKKEGNPIAE